MENYKRKLAMRKSTQQRGLKRAFSRTNRRQSQVLMLTPEVLRTLAELKTTGENPYNSLEKKSQMNATPK